MSENPAALTIEDKFELIASAQAVAIIPASAGITSLRPDLTTVPLEGVEPSHVVLATRAGDHSRLVAAFPNAPKLTSPDPAPPNQRASLPHEPRTNRRRTRYADGTFDLSRRRVRHEQ